MNAVMTKSADPGCVRGYKVLKRFQKGVSPRDISPPVARPEGRQRDRCKNDSHEQSFDNCSCSATSCGTGTISPAYGRLGNNPPKRIEIQAGLTKASRYPSIPTEHHEFLRN